MKPKRKKRSKIRRVLHGLKKLSLSELGVIQRECQNEITRRSSPAIIAAEMRKKSKLIAEFQERLVRDPTPEEKKLILALINKKIEFDFQKKIYADAKTFFVDFYIPIFNSEIGMVVEIDGGYHDQKHQLYLDSKRQASIEKLGIKVIRFTNEQVNKNIDGVISRIEIRHPVHKKSQVDSIGETILQRGITTLSA